ncbi:hypothetical protein BO71DRAFT_433950 [Aspergillus ellipticus CBS 707.79]|uniref:Ankyrin n=1 Tax=Aspergillus ellipticus CBS 707.79 TaxID=1448320 RepID=A0A319D025_9EURO|nr:hypothetical protein BO71DRAFT_433950 [Aspergillus ellipticus CBS 707.79]
MSKPYAKFTTSDPDCFRRTGPSCPPLPPIPPTIHTPDGTPLYETLTQSLLHSILRNDDLPLLHLYAANPSTRIFSQEYEVCYKSSVYIAARYSTFEVIRALAEIYMRDDRMTESLGNYCEEMVVSLMNVACTRRDRGMVEWLLEKGGTCPIILLGRPATAA